jgi:hypothetical protein
MRWTGHEAHMSEIRNSYKILVGNPERKRPHGRRRCKWEDNIRVDVRKIQWEVVDWIHMTQDRDRWWAVVNVVMNVRVP